jgi:hypothetical protein
MDDAIPINIALGFIVLLLTSILLDYFTKAKGVLFAFLSGEEMNTSPGGIFFHC